MESEKENSNTEKGNKTNDKKAEPITPKNLSSTTPPVFDPHLSKTSDDIPQYNYRITKKNWFAWTKSGLETLGFIAAILLAFFTWRTFKQVVKQTSAIVKSDSIATQAYISSDIFNRHALRNSDSSLNISSQNLKTISRNAEVELRAYLSIKDIEAAPLRVGKEAIAYIHYVNTGKTPARDVFAVTGMKIGGTGIYQAEFDSLKKNLEREQPLSPNNFATHTSFSVQIITKDDSVAISDGLKSWFIIGLFVYRDVFDVKHYTRYAVYYAPTIKTFTDYRKFNDTN